jgi:hypothetical protein
MRIRNVWKVPTAAALGLALAGCPGSGEGAPAAGGATAAGETTRPGMDFEVTVDTQRIGGPDTAAPAMPVPRDGNEDEGE